MMFVLLTKGMNRKIPLSKLSEIFYLPSSLYMISLRKLKGCRM